MERLLLLYVSEGVESVSVTRIFFKGAVISLPIGSSLPHLHSPDYVLRHLLSQPTINLAASMRIFAVEKCIFPANVHIILPFIYTSCQITIFSARSAEMVRLVVVEWQSLIRP